MTTRKPTGIAPGKTDTGSVRAGKVVFPPWRGKADKPAGQPVAPMPPVHRVGFALVGLGRLSLEELLPAFAECQKAKVTALVSGTPAKLKAVATQYGIAPEACYSYDTFDTLADNPAVQAVYIVLPNAMHREYTERAAAMGKHVLCEKPLATSTRDASAMVAACKRAGVTLMTAYRIHYQPHNMRARQYVQDKTFGRLVTMSATNVQGSAANAHAQWRHKKAMAGGGALPDIGLYCLNTARYVSGEEPEEVMAWMHSPAGDPRFSEIEASMSFMLRFPSGLVANCHTSYDAREDKHLRLNFNTATVDMPNAFAYDGQRLVIGQRLGDDSGNIELALTPANQFAAEIDHMAECILEGKVPDTPGEEGVKDHLLMEALYRSATSGKPVPIKRL